MINKKDKITEFIKSMEGDKLDSATCLMGGANGNPDGLMATTNGGDCINDSKDACNKSTNNGACKNVSNYCNNSKNGGACNNAYNPGTSPGPVTNTTITACS